jgi:glycosyltransferase involved in cell wall biosynthesis
VILEAMAHGLPVLSTRLAGIVEAIVDGESGLLVDQDDASGLAENLGRLVEEPELRERIGQGGRRRVAERFARSANLPGVIDALVEAGIIPPSQARGQPPSLQAVA